jgi:glucose-6-phosphate isomerase
MSSVTQIPAWKDLEKHYQEISDLHMRDLFKSDAERFDMFSLRLDDILFDYSKNRITRKTVDLLIELARQAGLAEMIEAMFSGEKINTTEGRAVLHVALRNRSNTLILVDGGFSKRGGFSVTLCGRESGKGTRARPLPMW